MRKRCRLAWWASNNAAVAQRIRASVYGTEGRGFESLQPHFFVMLRDIADMRASAVWFTFDIADV
jgi:hypothetical protein